MRRGLLETVGLLLTDISLRWLRRVRSHRVERLPRTRKLFAKRGVYPIVDHFYEPLITVERLDPDYRYARTLKWMDWRESAQWDLVESFEWGDELARIPLHRFDAAPNGYYLNNGFFGRGDADMYYSLIRQLNPQQVIEIGSGHSTRLAASALRENAHDNPAEAGTLTCIEPYRHPDWLEELGVEHLATPVEALGAAYFQRLAANDILFIDSSHMIRPQGDVLFEFFEIIPSLASGVYVHVHDIFTPRDYPNEWTIDRMQFWNEQYLLEAFLEFNESFEVVAGLQYLLQIDPDRLERALPRLVGRDNDIGTTSFWMRRR